MAKQLNVNLAFTADTGKAKAQLQDLQKQLNNLINGSGSNGMATQITEATKAAAELKVHLQNATNVKTGNLDFTKLNESIKSSGKSLVQYGEQLNSMGPQGQKAFMALAQSVSNAEVPIRRANTALAEMWTTLKNTARWQISSSILHGFMGAVQSAYGYAQDLNESLNNIRIVTGQNVEQMAAFAENANKAAKALSTTTTAYTNAALIYYQQGDKDETVLQKADVTAKMANVTGTSADEVSNQLTAIWNNFNKAGEESYERYADVLTALGAATASSTDEIAGGLEKFASIADMIGLSYDYAATALATITATTRQSEDVVGTALKTIFARIQGLNLGETLDDGTTLNKYSEALNKVGISIYEQNGELKDMDNILNEMGAKWQTLSKDQQVALAQTVAGVRQYNQLVSLMDNWDYFGENLEVARNSEGELNKQAEIYAESWQAASNRVRAALEGIYGTLIDDESFIDVLNIIEKIITYFDNLIDTVGGLSGVLTTLGAILTRVFSNQLAQSISNMAYSIKMMSPKQQAKAQAEKSNTIKEFAGIMASSEGSADSTAGQTASQVYTEKLNLQERMISNANRMSEAEKQQIQILMDQLSIQEKQTIEAAKQVDITKNKKSDAASKIYTNAARGVKEGEKFKPSAVADEMKKVATTSKALNSVSTIFQNINKNSKNVKDQLALIRKEMDGLNAANLDLDLNDDSVLLKQLLQDMEGMEVGSEKWATSLAQVQSIFQKINQESIDNVANNTNSEIEDVRQYSQAVIAADNAVDGLKKSQDDLSASNAKVGQSIDQAKGKVKTWADSLVSFANGALSIVSALQMVGGIVDTLENPDMSAWEKVLSIGSSVLMMVTMLIPTFTALMGAFGGTGAAAAGATGPVAGFGVALNAALGPIGWVALALTALVAVFAVVVTSLDTASEKAQKKFNQMSEDAKQAADALSEAEDSYNNLQDTISEYSDARDNIDSLTQGTEEFKDAILEANEAARTLIELYGVASKYNANTGLIEIDKEALDAAVELEQKKLESARISNVAAQSNKTMAASDLANAKVVEKNDESYWEKFGSTVGLSVASGMSVGAMAGAAGGIFAPITMTAGVVVGAISGLIGALGGAAVGIIEQNNTNEKQISALESLQDAYTQSGGNFEVAMDSLSESEQSLIDSLGLTDSELANLCSEVSANTAAVLQNNKQLVDSNFADNDEYQNSKYKDQLNTMMADDLAKETDRIYEEKWKDQSGGITDKEAQKAYAEMMGYTWVKNKDGNLGVYSKGDGSADFTVSDETARRALAQKEAMEALGQSVEKYNQTLETVNQTGEKFGDGVGDLMLRLAGGQGASFADATSTEIDALKEALEDADVATDIISDEDARNMGYDNAEAYVQALELGIASYEDGIKNIRRGLSSSISKDFLNEVEGLTLTGAESMAKNLTEAFKVSGKDAANALDDIFIDAGEDADELSTLLEGINWGDPNAVAKLNAAIEEQGLNIDTTSDEWKAYTAAMSAAGMAMGGVQSKFDALRQTMADTSGITKNLKTNDIISDDDYKKLLEVNPAIKEMFMVTADGYRFLGSQGDLSALLVGNAKENIAGVKEEFAALRAEGEEIADSDWFDSEGKKTISNNNDLVDMANEATDMDAALAYMGVSKDSLEEAAAYVAEHTRADGSMKLFTNKEKYEEYVQYMQDVYSQLGNIRQSYLDGDYSAEQAEQLIASTATNVAELQQLQADGAIGAEAFNQQLNVLTVEAFNAAESLDELKGAMQLAKEMGGEIDYTAYADNLMRIAEGYENCAKEVEAYQLALANSDNVEAAEDALETAIMIGEAAERYGLDAKEIEAQARQLAKEYNLDAEAAAKLAVNNQRMNKGIITLAENWKKWNKALKGSDKTSLDWAEAAVECTAAIADLVGASEDLELPDDFFNTENMTLLEDAINGDINAINKLGAAVATAQVKMLDFNGAFADLAMQTMTDNGLEIDITLDSTQFDADKALVLQGIDDIKNGVLGAGGEMDAEWVAALNRMALATGMSVDDMNGLLGELGVQAKVETTYVKQPMEVPTYTDHYEATQYNPPEYDENGEMIRPASWSNRKYTVPGEPLKVEGYAAVAQISTEDNPMTVDVESNTTTAGSPPSSGATFTGNRGTVADSTKDAVKEVSKAGKTSKKSVNRYEEEFNEFQKIEDKLDDLSRAYDRAGKLKDQAFGANKLKYIDDEIEALDDLIENQEIYIQNLKDARDKAFTDTETGIAQYGFTRDGNGNITNYDEITRQRHKDYEDAVDKYNKGEIDEETMEKLDEEYDRFKELLQIYMEYNSKWEEEQEKLLDYQIDKISKELEKITIKVDSEVELNQRDLDKLDYIVEKLNRGLNKAIEVITTLEKSVSRYQNQSVAIRNGIDEIKAKAAKEGRDLTDDEQRQIWDYEDQLLDINRSLYDLMDTVDNSVLEEFEKLNDEIDENIGRFDTYNEALDYYSSIITLSGRATKDSALLMSIATQKVDTSMSKLNSSYAKYLANVEAQKDALAHLNAATSDEDKEYWKKQYDEITKAVETSHNEVLGSWEEVLQAASDKFDLSVQQTLETLKSSISEYGLDGLADRYEKATEEQERYLSNLDKEYELNKLSREIAKSIDETDNVHAKQELNKLLEEINAKQESGIQMSEYDLEIMQKQYDVEMAKLALEEARNAKSTVRLRKDNEGNFGYVYTADQDKIDDAEQNYEDKLYELQKTSEDYIKEMSDMIIQNEQDMIAALESIDKTRFNTKEEYEAEVARITKYYLDKDLYLRQELDKAVVASGKTYGDTILGQMENATSWQEAHETLKTNTNAATVSMGEAWQTWHTTTTEAMGAVGTSADGFTTTITNDLTTIGTATTTLEGDIKTSTDNMSTYIGNLMTKVSEFRAQYISDIQDMIDMNEKWVGINGTDLTTPETKEPPKVEEEVKEEPKEKPADPGAPKQQKISHSDMVDLVVDMGQGDYGNGSARRKAVEAKYPGICSIAQGILNQAIREDNYNYHHNGNKWKSQTVDRLVTAAGYDTGGYTGVWGPEGKLAFLHEKELVLNKDDTSNLLTSIDLLHNIISQIDLMAASHSILGGLMSPSFGGGQGTLEQEVHIEAHFPNATNHSEIEEAFGNLINLASQYANRK